MKKISILVLTLILVSCVKYNNQVMLNLDIRDVVTEKYIDKMSHFENTVKFQSGGKLGLFEWEQVDTTLFSCIQIGDSISKNKGEYSLFVYKKDGTVKEFKYRDGNGKVYSNKKGL